MPSFTFTSPQGKQYTVTGPAGATVQQAFGILQQQLASTSASAQQPTAAPDPPAAPSDSQPASSGQLVAGSAPFQPAAPTQADNFVAGVGKSFADIGRGAKELAEKWGNKLGMVSNQHLSQYQAQLAQDQQQDAPLMATTAGKVGDLTGNIAMGAVFPEEAGLAGAVGGGAALGGLQPTTGNGSQTENAVIGGLGGLAGDVAGRVAGRVVQPIRNVLDDSRLQAVQLLRNAGVPLDLAQATGSRTAATLKNVASDAPFVNASTFPHVQQAAFNNAVLKTFGASGTKATPAVMDTAARRIGAIFDDIATRNPVAVDSPLLDDLANVHEAAGRELSAADAAPIKAQIENVIDKAASNGGNLDGKAYQNIRSSLGRLSTNSPNGSIRHFAGELRSGLDDALQRSVSPQDLDSLTNARRQYRAMKQTEDGIQNDTDDISPAALANAIDRKANASQSVYGRGDQTLVQLANAGKLMLGKGTANSGTTRRLLGYVATAEGANALYRVARGQSIDSNSMMEAAIAGGFAPMAARAIVESPAGREWLTRWASSQVAERAAGAALTAGRRIGAGVGGMMPAQSAASSPAPQQ